MPDSGADLRLPAAGNLPMLLSESRGAVKSGAARKAFFASKRGKVGLSALFYFFYAGSASPYPGTCRR